MKLREASRKSGNYYGRRRMYCWRASSDIVINAPNTDASVALVQRYDLNVAILRVLSYPTSPN